VWNPRIRVPIQLGMPALPAHRCLRTLALLACLGASFGMGPAPTPDEADTDAKKNFVERAVSDVRGTIDDAIISAKDTAHASYGLERFVRTDTGDEWESVDGLNELPEHAVIFVHGLDEPGGIWSDVAPKVHAHGHEVFRFRYPNDGKVSPSAVLFASWLVSIRARGVTCVDIVAHSMGGLVSYEMLTRDGLYAGVAFGHDDLPDVRRLITVGTPWHGSALAPLRGVMEAREHLANIANSGDGNFTDRALRFLADGSGEAGEDLTPGSAFLTELHERPMPTGTTLTTIIGRLETDDLETWRTNTVNGFVSSVIGKERAEAMLTVFQGVSYTVGDGAVSESSAHLCGVDDVVALRADHRSLVKKLNAPGFVRGMIGAPDGTPPAIPVILSRINEQCGCGHDR